MSQSMVVKSTVFASQFGAAAQFRAWLVNRHKEIQYLPFATLRGCGSGPQENSQQHLRVNVHGFIAGRQYGVV